MAMGAHTGCNTVYGSTPPNNPHPYPWMNSLFQDGATVTWLFGESFIMDHARRSVIPERLADAARWRRGRGADRLPSDATVRAHALHRRRHDATARSPSCPRPGRIGGDGGMGDIGFQNVSKVILQNRPNVKLLMLDTQVYSNTGGQNSDSSPDARRLRHEPVRRGHARARAWRRRALAEIFIAGHGSPFVAQVSMANAPQLLPGDSRRPRLSRHRLPAVLHHLPARARRRRRSGHAAGAARPRHPRHARVRLRPAIGRDLSPRPWTSRAIPRSRPTGGRRAARTSSPSTATRSPTGRPPRPASGSTSAASSPARPRAWCTSTTCCCA